MRTGVFLFGGVEMTDAGGGPPASTDRRSSQDEMWRATEQLADLGVDCERLGYDIFWLTEHHFQHEGYEVVPNGILFGATLAARTSRIRIGTMFNIVPQWHPLRLAEDFAYLHNVSGGRALFGVGRGTVPAGGGDAGDAHRRPSTTPTRRTPTGSTASSSTRPSTSSGPPSRTSSSSSPAGTTRSRRPGIPDRGGYVEHLTLVPRPLPPRRVVAGGHVTADARGRAPQGLRRRCSG